MLHVEPGSRGVAKKSTQARSDPWRQSARVQRVQRMGKY